MEEAPSGLANTGRFPTGDRRERPRGCGGSGGRYPQPGRGTNRPRGTQGPARPRLRAAHPPRLRPLPAAPGGTGGHRGTPGTPGTPGPAVPSPPGAAGPSPESPQRQRRHLGAPRTSEAAVTHFRRRGRPVPAGCPRYPGAARCSSLSPQPPVTRPGMPVITTAARYPPPGDAR